MSTAGPEHHLQALLESLGITAEQFPETEGTPQRVAALLQRWLVPPAAAPEITPVQSPAPDALVVVKELPFYALCAHHLLPFFGHFSVAYLPEEHLIGFGHLHSLVDHITRGPQLQETVTDALATQLEALLAPRGLVVQSHARQFCMEMAGAEKPAETSVLIGRGVFAGKSARAVAAQQFA